MANDITGDPLVIDTAASNITTKTFVVTKIRWVGATAAGNTISVQNSAGAVKFAAEATRVNYSESEHFDPPLKFEGLSVPTLASGKVYLYLFSAVPIKT